ncbi:phage tail tape measure protein [Trabulsiella odontotermitis]|uniref:phage tail tape measure protein n=1 Tax=Trabulsiella odontotermitis TaxID=379893 RepID=UPI0006761E0C|nr:phage tail tape measure protein [Trabulsiella odontotermitis]KNC89897.1 phage tail length tape measure protein [Trabulsiella odontotermitis]
MARNLQLALSLVAKDGASKALRQAMQGILAQTKANQKAGDELARSQQQNTTTGIRASRSLQDEYRRASSARSTLGIRSEREIQREIRQTIASYNRLTRSGLMSAREQSRAFRAMSEQVRTLRTELKGVSNVMTRLQGLKGAATTVGAVAGGVTAAAMVIKDPVQRQMAFDRRNAEIANTAYNNLAPQERIKKIPGINDAIRGAVRYGGGTPESAQNTLSDLFAGGLDEKTAMALLPDITRYSTASGANPQQLAKIGIAAYKNFGISLEDLPAVYDKAIRSGENGKYELADMAESLPLTMTKAKSVGMSGLDDLDVILAMLQANAETAGDNSAASTNVNNLLDKYTSADTQNALKNKRFRTQDGKVLPYADYMADQRLRGVNTSDAFTNAVSGIVSSDKRVQRLRAEAEKYKGTDREKDILAALDIVVSSITSKIIADQQASTALKTSIMKRDYIAEQKEGTKNSTGAGAASFEVISSTNDFKSQQLESEKMFAEQDSMKPVADLYGDLATKLTDYAKEYPELTTAISGATTAIKAMTAAAVAFAGINFLTGGGIKLPGGKPGGGISLPGGGSKAGGLLKNLFRYGGRIGGPLAAAYAAYDVNEKFNENEQAAQDAGMSPGEYAWKKRQEAEKNKKPLFDTDLPDTIKSWWSPPTTIGQNGATPLNPATTGVPSYLLPQKEQPQPINITTKLTLDGREIASAVNEYNGEQFNRGSTGGPQ